MPADATEQTSTAVLLHGLAGSARAFDRLAPLLERTGHRVVRVDRPGAPGYAIEAQAADALRAFDGPAAVVVGHSMGGHVATAMAERAAERVGRLVLVDTAPTLESRLRSERGVERLVRSRGIGPVLWAIAPERRQRASLSTAFAPGATVPDLFVEDVRATSWRAFARSTAAIDAYLRERPLAERLAALDVEVDVIFGEADQRVDPAAARAYDGMARVRVTRVPRAGHSPIWEAPEAVAAAILR